MSNNPSIFQGQVVEKSNLRNKPNYDTPPASPFQHTDSTPPTPSPTTPSTNSSQSDNS